jgi:hypothetical protein
MKLAFIGTYPPRECGIGTFTKNLFNAMLDKNSETKLKSEGFVVAMNDNDLTYKYPEEVKLTIRQQRQEDYLKAAELLT